MTERAGHVLAEVSNGLGIIVSPPMGKTVLEHARMWLLPDGRVVVVLISPGGSDARQDFAAAPSFTQAELDRDRGVFEPALFGLDAGSDSRRPAAEAGERARALRRHRAERADAVRSGGAGRGQCAARARGRHGADVGAAEFADQAQLRDLLAAIEEKHRLVTVLNACIDTPEPVHVQIGVKEIFAAGENLALISAPYTQQRSGAGFAGRAGTDAHAL